MRNWAFLGGFVLMVNFYLLPFLPASPRGTDTISAFLVLAIVWRLAKGRQSPQPVTLALLVGLIPLIWLFFALMDGHGSSVLVTVRWLLALPWAVALTWMLESDEKQLSFARGLFVGGIFNVLVIVLQWLGAESQLQMVGLSSSDASYHHFVSHQVRIPGLHGHHNSSSSVISLMVPAGFFLYYRNHLKASVLYGGLGALLVAIHLTSTRSPLIVAFLSIFFISAQARRLHRSVLVGAVLLGVMLPLVMVYGPPGGWSRWKNKEALISNATERLDSGQGAWQLCLDNPLGIEVDKGHEELEARTGIKATHNAFLQAALTWGLLFGFLLLLGIVTMIVKSLGGIGNPLFLPGILAFHAAGLFMFEEHLNNPTFVIIAAWAMVTAFRTGKLLSDSP